MFAHPSLHPGEAQMRLVKIFMAKEDRSSDLESDINQWVEQSGAHLVSVTGNVAPQSQVSYPNKKPEPSDVLVVVVYEPATVAV